MSKKNTNQIHCLFGVRREIDIFWIDRLETLARDYENFSYTLTLSQPTSTWDGKLGRVTDHLGKIDTRGQYFGCGNLEMIKDVRELLTAAEVPMKQIHFEIFH